MPSYQTASSWQWRQRMPLFCRSARHPLLSSFFASPAFLIGVWVFFQVGIFLFRAIFTLTDDLFTSSRMIFGAVSLAIARGSSLPIAIDSGLILLPVSLRLLNILPCGLFGHRVVIHRLISLSIIFWSIVHTLAHLVGFFYSAFHLTTANSSKINSPTISSSFISVFMALFGSVAGISGLLLVSFLLALFLFSYSIKNYETFWWVHRIIFPFYYIALGIHGSFCFFLVDQLRPVCPTSTDWMWFVPFLGIYWIDWLLRSIMSWQLHAPNAVILHPGDVVELRWQKNVLPVYKHGQYVLLTCNALSRFQAHPFTLTSAPEEPFISVHIRSLGDWTFSLRTLFERNAHRGPEEPYLQENGAIQPSYSSLATFSIGGNISSRVFLAPPPDKNGWPVFHLDGSYGNSFQEAFSYEILVCIGAGIGQTPFASLLKSIWYRHPVTNASIAGKPCNLRKIYYVGIAREVQAFSWFYEILRSLEESDKEKIFRTLPPDAIWYVVHLGGEGTSSQQQQPANVLTSSQALSLKPLSPTFEEGKMGRDPLSGLITPTSYGRPDLSTLINRICIRHSSSQKIGVFYCGSPKLCKFINNCCMRSSHSARIFFRGESFNG